MSGAAIEYLYRYPFASDLAVEAEPELRLATCTDADLHPYFFQGTLRQPHRTAKLLLALVWLLRMRFLARRDLIQAGLADPIITAHESFLRLEIFSGCCSVYARVDLPPDALDGSTMMCGTTNVDFNPPLIAALGKIRPTDDLQLSVGADEFVLERNRSPVVEKRVQLPIRWLKGLVAVTLYSAKLQLSHEVNALQALQFLRSLPRQVDHRSRWWVCRSGSGLRLSQRESNDAVETGGLERLRVLDDIVPLAKSLRVYSAKEVDASAWELDLGDARFTMLMTHDVWRGFSGEGQGLQATAKAISGADLVSAQAALRWQSVLDPNTLSRSASERSKLLRGLEHLAAQGLVGFDVANAHYFHRELPFDFDLVRKLQPRLKGARQLLEDRAVTSPRTGEFHVRSNDTTHTVRQLGDETKCTCPWYAKHQNRRGPCKHILAVQLYEEQTRGT